MIGKLHIPNKSQHFSKLQHTNQKEKRNQGWLLQPYLPYKFYNMTFTLNRQEGLLYLLPAPTGHFFSRELRVFQAPYSDCQHHAVIYGHSLCKGNNLKRRELCLRFWGCGWSHTSTAVKQWFFFGLHVLAELTDRLFRPLGAKPICRVDDATYKAPGSNRGRTRVCHKQIKESTEKQDHNTIMRSCWQYFSRENNILSTIIWWRRWQLPSINKLQANGSERNTYWKTARCL